MYKETTTPMNEEKSYKFIDLEYMEMMSDGDDSMKKVMLEMLLKEIPEELEKMNACVADSNWEELSSVSHKMKSTLAFVGNNSMTKANKELELNSKQVNNVDAIPDLVKTLESSYSNVVVELKKELASL